MRTLFRALGIGFVTAVVGGALAAYCADVSTRVNNVSDFEGGRGMFIAFVLVPAAAIGSFAVGAIVAVVGPMTGRGSYLVRQSRAIAVASLVIGAIAGLSALTADQAPLIDGLAAEIELELRLPQGEPLPDIAGQELKVALYGSHRDNQYVTLDPDSVVEHDGRAVVPGVATLLSKVTGRTLSIHEGSSTRATFELPVPAHPTSADSSWTSWTRPSSGPGGGDVPANTYEVRYRIVAVVE